MRKMLVLILLLFSVSGFSKTIYLNPNNHYFLNESVNDFSMKMATSMLEALDKKLPRGLPLYLVLKTPGGSVIAGMEFISAMKQLSRPIVTVSIQSISMGFQIVQALGPRYVVTHGIIMTHPISGSCQGRIPAIQSCLEFMTELANSLDRIAAERMRMSLKEYQRKSSEEWWTVGVGALESNMADTVVSIKCNDKLLEKGVCPN